MTARRILVVEDEKAIRDMIAFGLRRAGYEVREAEDCREARARIVDVRPDLMLIDWMLPDMSGLELTRSLKRAKDTEEIPVIMLTPRAEEQDKVNGLEGGADDYITKPFSPRELLARIQAVLRRAAPAGADDIVEVDGLKLDDSSHRVSAGEREIALGPTEYRLLHFFMTHPERGFRRGQLLDRVWGVILTWRSAPWTCTFADCVRRSNPFHSIGWCKRRVARVIVFRRETPKQALSPWQRCGPSRSRGSRACCCWACAWVCC